MFPRSACYAEGVEKEENKAANQNSDAPSFADLAAGQGVRPVTDFDTLLGHPSPEDDSVDEFSAMLREWRHEGAAPAR